MQAFRKGAAGKNDVGGDPARLGGTASGGLAAPTRRSVFPGRRNRSHTLPRRASCNSTVPTISKSQHRGKRSKAPRETLPIGFPEPFRNGQRGYGPFGNPVQVIGKGAAAVSAFCCNCSPGPRSGPPAAIIRPIRSPVTVGRRGNPPSLSSHTRINPVPPVSGKPPPAQRPTRYNHTLPRRGSWPRSGLRGMKPRRRSRSAETAHYRT